MGFHTRGEMGGVWTPPIKLVDGIWFGVGKRWIGPATRFTSGYGHVRMRLPGSGGLSVERTDFVPGEARGVLVGLRLQGRGRRTVKLRMQTHSELMSIYPWGETNPEPDDLQPGRRGRASPAARWSSPSRGTPPVANAEPHDWAAAVGSSLRPRRARTGAAFRGPQGALICPVSGPDTPAPARERCDDTAYGKGKGGQLTYRVRLPRSGRTTVWFGVAGSETGAARRAPRARAHARPPRRGAAREGPRARGAAAPHAARPPGRPAARPRHRLEQAEPRRLRAGGARPRDPRGQRGQELPAREGHARPRALRRRRLPRLPVDVRHRRRVHRVRLGRARPVRADQGAPARAAARVAAHQRRQRQGRPRGGHRRLGLLRRQRRPGQHGRDRQVPERRGADLALDRRQRVPRRDVRLREGEPGVHLPRARRRRRRLARGPRQRRAHGHGRGEARQHDRDDARAARPRGPREVQGRHRHREVGGRQGRRPRGALRARLVDARGPAARRLARRRATPRSSSATGSASRRWRSRPCATAASCRA